LGIAYRIYPLGAGFAGRGCRGHLCGHVGLGQEKRGCEGCSKTVQGGEVLFGEFFARLCSQFTSGLAEAGQKIVVLAMKLLVVGGQRVGMVVCPVLEAAYVHRVAGLCNTGMYLTPGPKNGGSQ